MIMNYYKRLELEKDASEKEITRAFRILAKRYHPDLNKSNNAKQEFIEIFEAYTILKDITKRKTYDSIIKNTTEAKDNEVQEKKEYNNWKQKAYEDGTYYSNMGFRIFNEEVLKKLKEVGKFTQRVLIYFGLLIATGLISTFIIRPIFLIYLETSLQKSIRDHQEYSRSNNVSESTIDTIIESNDEEKPLPLPLFPLLKDWKRIYIENVGTIDIPPTMEVQSGIYKEIIDPLKPTVMKSMGISSNSNYDIIIQQKGLNDLDNNGFQRYARVMINTDIGNKGDFDSLTFNINEYSELDIREFDTMFNAATKQSFEGTPIKLVQWFPLRLEIINGMSCIHISYARQLNNNPIVQVDLYKFQDIDKMYTLTLSYRQNEKDYWNEYFPTILRSFRIE